MLFHVHCTYNFNEETVVKEVDAELFEVGIGEMG